MVLVAVLTGVAVAIVVGLAIAFVIGAQVRRVASSAGREGERAATLREGSDRQLVSELHRMGDLVADLQRRQAAQHGELTARLGEAAQATAMLGNTARALQQALGNGRVRGQWGERMADDVLRLAGLVEGINYLRQATLANGSRPDVTFLLPEGRRLHMDVKFPADHYLEALEAPDEATRRRCERAFLADVRSHLRAVAGRGYADVETTPGLALVFIPNEAIYGFVVGADPGLVDTALAHGLVLCSPFTLFAVLAVVRQATEAFRLGQASAEILSCLGRFRSQWDRFGDQLDKVARQWETAHRGLEELTGTRRRQLERVLDQVDQLQPEERRHASGDHLTVVDRISG